MKISYNASADLIKPTRKEILTEEIQEVIKFLDSDNENLVFEYDDEETARKRRNSVATHSRKKDLEVKALLRGNKVIVIRKKEK